jgi:hypothetical protein
MAERLDENTFNTKIDFGKCKKKIMKTKFPVCLQQKLKYKNYESVKKWVSVKSN